MADRDSRFGDDESMAEWQAFVSDNRHIRYEDTSDNWDSIFDFLKQHSLYFTAESLHLAYVTLGDTLELTPLAEPIYVEPPAPIPTKSPAPIPIAPDPRAPIAWRNGKAIQLTNPQRIG